MKYQIKPLHFFDSLINRKGLENLENEFKPSAEEIAQGSVYFDQKAFTKTYYWQNHYDPTIEETKEDFSNDFLVERLTKECHLVKDSISTYYATETPEKQRSYLKEQLRQLKYLDQSVSKKIQNNKAAVVIKRFLLYIEGYLNNTYVSSSGKRNNKKLNSFKLMPQKKDQQFLEILSKVHDELSNGFISTEHKDFLRILKTENNISDKLEVHFLCQTVEAAFILNQISTFVKGFSWRNIESAQLFYSKKGKLLKATNLSKSYRQSLLRNDLQKIASIFNALNG